MLKWVNAKPKIFRYDGGEYEWRGIRGEWSKLAGKVDLNKGVE